MAELTVRAFFHIGDEVVPIEQISSERLAKAKENMKKNLERGMSEYYSEHPDEFIKLCKSCAGDHSAAR